MTNREFLKLNFRTDNVYQLVFRSVCCEDTDLEECLPLTCIECYEAWLDSEYRPNADWPSALPGVLNA